VNFADSLVEGKRSEQIILSMIHSKYPNAFIKEGYHKEYDIMIPEINKTIEVKKDFKSQYTGNIVIEIEMNNKKSALSTTTADWWVIHTDNCTLFWISPKDINKIIEKENFKPVEFIGKGDTISKIAYLIPKEYFFKYATYQRINKGT